MKNNILTTVLSSLTIALTAVATTGCGNSGKTSGQQEGKPEQDLIVEVAPSQVISGWEKAPDYAAFNAALRAVDSVAQYNYANGSLDAPDYAKEFCELYARQNPSTDFSNVLNLPGLNPGATIQETAAAIDKAAKEKIAYMVIPVLERRLKDAGATYIDIKPAAGHFSAMRVLVGGLGKADLHRLISSKGSINFMLGGASEAKKALTEIDRRSGNRLSSRSYSYTQIADPRSDMQSGARRLDFGYAMIGYFRQADKNEADSIINSEEARALLPAGIRLLWSYSPENYGDNYYGLYALKDVNLPADEQYITEAGAEYDEIMGWYISMKFNDEGARIFERMTDDNIGGVIAIVFDGKVLSAPRVIDKIAGGNVHITGNYDETTCKMLAAIMKGGSLPWKCQVIQSRPYSESAAVNGDAERRDR